MKVEDTYFSFLDKVLKHAFGFELELSLYWTLIPESESFPSALDVSTIPLSCLVLDLSAQYIPQNPT